MARALMTCLAFWPALAMAQAVADPTRPPSIVDVTAGMAGSAAAPVSPLQSVILRPGSKPRALLGGEWIELGQEFNGARLVKVTDTGVVLSGPSGRETLYLTPDAEKKLTKVVPKSKPGKTRETK